MATPQSQAPPLIPAAAGALLTAQFYNSATASHPRSSFPQRRESRVFLGTWLFQSEADKKRLIPARG